MYTRLESYVMFIVEYMILCCCCCCCCCLLLFSYSFFVVYTSLTYSLI